MKPDKILKFQFIFFLIYLTQFQIQSTLGQIPSRDNFIFAFENDFENNQLGDYLLSDWWADWKQSGTMASTTNIDIISENNSKFMRGHLEEGKYQPARHGYYWDTKLATTLTELYISYDIRFKPGFEWVLGGKMPFGLSGGPIASGQLPTPESAWTVRTMWSENGILVFYVYHQDQPIQYGSSYGWGNFAFTSGKWYNITIRVVLNTFSNGVALNDGILEGFIDGKLLFQKSNFKFRGIESIKIDNLIFSAFFGGNTPEWAATRDEWIDTDNYVAYTYSTKPTNVPRGRQLHSSGSQLLHPYINYSGNPGQSVPAVPSNLATGLITKNSIGLKWVDNSINESGFRLFRSLNSTDFSEIATLGANTTSYTDNNLQPLTNYYYKILAYNQYGNSGFSPVMQVSTTLLTLPAPPTEFSSPSQSSTSVDLVWKDNSTREEGFKLYRSLNETDGFLEVASCGVNETSCSDRSLRSSTNYYYKLRAFNSDGFSEYTPVIRVSTLESGIPEPPPSDTGNHNHYSFVYIDPKNISDPNANGTVEHPFDSWSKVVWKEGGTYLQKRNTTASINMLQIGSNNITLGSYGEGTIPVLESTSTTYMISAVEKSGIRIHNLSLSAPNAMSVIYFLGSSKDTTIIENCTINGSNSAIKVMDASTLIVRYNVLKSEQEGIFSTAALNEIKYNIFENTFTAINITNSTSKVSVLNNVFYNNSESISILNADLNLYNNIFYLTEANQKALILGSSKIHSDNNIYFPEQNGFISVTGKTFNNLAELQKTLKTDLNSLTSNPLFFDIVTENFRLKSNSPAINRGKNIVGTKDLDGIKVPLFGKTDIGAYEFNGNISPGGKLLPTDQLNLKAYPNPTNGDITIEAALNDDLTLQDPSVRAQELKIFDISGKVLISKKIDLEGSLYQENLDLSQFLNGIYFVTVRIGDKIVQEKILLQK